jgi:hypothetical protein
MERDTLFDESGSAIPPFVMAGLEPAIHGVPRPPASVANFHGQFKRNRVDALVKPGHDGYETASRYEILDRGLFATAGGLTPWPM